MKRKFILLLTLISLFSVSCKLGYNLNSIKNNANNISKTNNQEASLNKNNIVKTINYNTFNKASSKNSIKKVKGLVNILDIDSSIVVDLKYATKDNFTGIVLYKSKICLLRESTAIKLKNVNTELKKMGYRIKIYDGYRPPSVQKIMWEKTPDKRYVANPYKKGSVHSKGCAVDVTIVDKYGNELEMPSKFDEFSIKASRKNPNMSTNAKKNLELLTNIMLKNGFKYINSEWWHFEDVDKDKYEIVEIDPSKF
ncbi:M15 family metallopeptidase [Thermobrachium celere]|uniref:M15 family metallopeptidase n=1 Tax=Thermobrachium celere TaxID=53422 RepID=UPI0019452B13|nr:M15 family metallopeptidase [Thermobrachium celere]GFR34580.1 hypothetical protein TCEA9_03920 [Thermobrachium celere]